MSDSKSLNVRHHGSELNVCFQSTLKFLTNWPGPKKENRKYWLTIIGFVFRHLETIFGLLGEILGWATRGQLGTRFPVFLLEPL